MRTDNTVNYTLLSSKFPRLYCILFLDFPHTDIQYVYYSVVFHTRDVVLSLNVLTPFAFPFLRSFHNQLIVLRRPIYDLYQKLHTGFLFHSEPSQHTVFHAKFKQTITSLFMC